MKLEAAVGADACSLAAAVVGQGTATFSHRVRQARHQTPWNEHRRKLGPWMLSRAHTREICALAAEGWPCISPPGVCFTVDQADDCRVAAQPVQVAVAVGPDAPDRDTQPGADLGVGHRRVND